MDTTEVKESVCGALTTVIDESVGLEKPIVIHQIPDCDSPVQVSSSTTIEVVGADPPPEVCNGY